MSVPPILNPQPSALGRAVATAQVSRTTIGILVTLKEELQAVQAAVQGMPAEGAARVRLARCGLGGASAAAAAGKLLADPHLKLLVSSGFCGGLIAQLGRGDIVLADAVTARAGTGQAPVNTAVLAPCPQAFAAAAAALKTGALPFHVGPVITVAQPVLRPAEKLALGRATGALAVDMEGAAVARAARDKAVGFLLLRAVSDAASDELPAEAAAFLDESGAVRPGPVLRYAVGGPAHLRGLWRLKRGAAQAAAALTRAWQVVLPQLL